MNQVDQRWINDRTGIQHNFNVDKYYTGTNPSYIEVYSNYRAGLKISYDPRDHSAVTSSVSGNFVSKWAWGPLVRHLPEQCPFYPNATIKYYEFNPSISGSNSLLCYNVERVFSTNITSMEHATLTWTPGSYITQIGDADEPQYKVKGSGNGGSNVNFHFSTPSGYTWSSVKSFWAGTPLITNQKVDGSSYYIGKQICPGNHWLSVTPIGDGAGNATWVVPSGIPYYVGYNTLDFTFPTSLNNISISARSTNSCGISSNTTFYLTKKTYGCPQSLVMALYPNPASDNVSITINENPSSVEVADSGQVNLAIINDVIEESITFTIRIYNSQSMLVSTFTRGGKSFNIPLINLRDGTYIIEVSDGKNSYQQQLILKHN
jgi:hypothetical protein